MGGKGDLLRGMGGGGGGMEGKKKEDGIRWYEGEVGIVL